MKKSCLIFLLFSVVTRSLAGQSIDWNIRGGINIMDSKTAGKDVSVLYHAGAEAGIRIANFGFYGELLYSVHENQYGGDPVEYIIPAFVVKGYPRKILLAEMGIAFLKMIGDSGVANDSKNPDAMAYFFAGLGLHFSKIEISFRSNIKQSYPVIQATLALKF